MQRALLTRNCKPTTGKKENKQVTGSLQRVTIYGPRPILSAGWVSLMGQDVKTGQKLGVRNFSRMLSDAFFPTFSIKKWMLIMFWCFFYYNSNLMQTLMTHKPGRAMPVHQPKVVFGIQFKVSCESHTSDIIRLQLGGLIMDQHWGISSSSESC